MNSTDSKELRGITLWYDPNIKNVENSQYKKDLIEICEFHAYKDIDDLINNLDGLLSNSNSNKILPIIVMTSGTNGEKLTKRIVGKPILGIIVFCYDIECHKKWTEQYNLIKTVVNNFDDVKKSLYKLYEEEKIVKNRNTNNLIDMKPINQNKSLEEKDVKISMNSNSAVINDIPYSDDKTFFENAISIFSNENQEKLRKRFLKENSLLLKTLAEYRRTNDKSSFIESIKDLLDD